MKRRRLRSKKRFLLELYLTGTRCGECTPERGTRVSPEVSARERNKNFPVSGVSDQGKNLHHQFVLPHHSRPSIPITVKQSIILPHSGDDFSSNNTLLSKQSCSST